MPTWTPPVFKSSSRSPNLEASCTQPPFPLNLPCLLISYGTRTTVDVTFLSFVLQREAPTCSRLFQVCSPIKVRLFSLMVQDDEHKMNVHYMNTSIVEKCGCSWDPRGAACGSDNCLRLSGLWKVFSPELFGGRRGDLVSVFQSTVKMEIQDSALRIYFSF